MQDTSENWCPKGFTTSPVSPVSASVGDISHPEGNSWGWVETASAACWWPLRGTQCAGVLKGVLELV